MKSLGWGWKEGVSLASTVRHAISLYCIVLYLLLILNPKSYDGARAQEASGRPLVVKGRS